MEEETKVPVSEKVTLTIKETAANKKLVKRREFEKFLEKQLVI